MYCLFTAVGAALHTAARVDAAPFAAVGVRVMLPILQRFAYVLPFTPLEAAPFFAVGGGVMLPVSLRLTYVLPFTPLLG